MRFAIFGLGVSSAWGNGHATLWRGLIRELDRLGHHVTFYEKDVSYYAAHRDLHELPGASCLRLYEDFTAIEPEARACIRSADVAMVTSYCPDGARACEVVLEAGVRCRAFYDLDTPVTIERVRAGETVGYLPKGGLSGFDLVLSYTGGGALDALRTELGARRVAPLYGSVDPELHAPGRPRAEWSADCSYLGTYSADRQDALDALFLAPARERAERKFVLGGSMYPEGFPWTANVWYVAHVAPADHASFYASSPITVSVTRGPFAALGLCPSGRLFEAAACGTPVLSDLWRGIEEFFTPGSEILVARDRDEALAAIELPREQLARIGQRARERTLDEHTAAHRARELVRHLEESMRPRSVHDASAPA